jgi:hypothetical protein
MCKGHPDEVLFYNDGKQNASTERARYKMFTNPESPPGALDSAFIARARANIKKATTSGDHQNANLIARSHIGIKHAPPESALAHLKQHWVEWRTIRRRAN